VYVSSSRNLSSGGDREDDIVSASCEPCCISEGCFDRFRSNTGKCLNYLFDRASGGKHFKHLPDHHPGPFESGLAVADVGVYDDIFVDVDSHKDTSYTIAEHVYLNDYEHVLST
jgi:hypothetical protein